MKHAWLVIGTGFALFSMFFGSGNLVFPLTVGQSSEGSYLLASLGILLTGVLVPFLGVWGMMLFQGHTKDFFQCFGRWGVWGFTLLSLALMGPFGVLARCLTVAHGALLLILPNASLPITSAVLCIVIYLLARHPGRIVPLLGTVLTPFLLLSIIVIAYFGLGSGSLPPSTDGKAWQAFQIGFFQGYQTMDLLAAFFFSQFVIRHLEKRQMWTEQQSLDCSFYSAALVGATILSAVYCVLVLLGWSYSSLLADIPPQEMLGAVAMASLGDMAGPWVCLAVIFACLTTAIVLATLFADFLRAELMQNRVGSRAALIVTLLIGFSVSTLDFAGISRFLGPVLEAVYPALIALTVVNIVSKFFGARATHWPFTATLLLKLCWI